MWKTKVSFLHLALISLIMIVCFLVLYRYIDKLRKDYKYLQLAVESYILNDNNSKTSAENIPDRATHKSKSLKQSSSLGGDLGVASTPIMSERSINMIKPDESLQSVVISTVSKEQQNLPTQFPESDENLSATDDDELVITSEEYQELLKHVSEHDSDSENESDTINDDSNAKDLLNSNINQHPLNNPAIVENSTELSQGNDADTDDANEIDSDSKDNTQDTEKTEADEDITFEMHEDNDVLNEKNLNKKNINELKQILKEKKLPVSGSKSELINRILSS